ncbi:MAG: alpha/beta hydrolase [Deltaproteobacteria bacterium]|jgi:pimeloyl-ACP methyl ester carboxylesterase|nr:alpha/beta hydrolase [Deltaproteobacteria bacterium]MBW2501107.1 alpha/beta hydrolase [Deltaproteobacteria bacterium]
MNPSSDLEPLRRSAQVGGIELVFFEWNPAARGQEPTLLLAHATGFHARCWDRMIPHLGARHVVAVDMRGHGRSKAPPIEHWRVLGQDLSELVGSRGFDSLLGVGHSMGGHAMVDAAAIVPDLFLGLVLLDPVIGPPEGYVDGVGKGEAGGEALHPIARRRNHFDSPREMFERFADRRPYSLFDPDVLWDYCEHGLLPASESGSFALACPPHVEASVYVTSRSNTTIFESVREISVPVQIVRAMDRPPDRDVMDFSASPTWPELVHEFPDASDVQLAKLSHFLPMQDPARIAALILDHEAKCRVQGSDRPPTA